jgi:hypothetical protein
LVSEANNLVAAKNNFITKMCNLGATVGKFMIMVPNFTTILLSNLVLVGNLGTNIIGKFMMMVQILESIPKMGYIPCML